MFVFFCIWCMFCSVHSRCVWNPPATMFPEQLIRMKTDDRYFHPRRRMSAMTVVNGQPVQRPLLLTNADDRERYANAVPGTEHHRLRHFSGGLNPHGNVEFSIVFDKAYASPGMLYEIVDIIPSSYFSDIDLDTSATEVDIVKFTRTHLYALQFQDMVRVGVGVRSPCLLDHEIGRVYYEFDVTADYDLYHSFNNTLVSDNEKVWTSQGWESTASLISYPPVNLTQEIVMNHVDTPCQGSRFESSLDILNTSQFTYWDIDTYSYKTDIKFIGHENYSTPRCHRREEGNICVVVAKARLTFGHCDQPVKFFIYQSVSHIARMSRQIYNTQYKPSNFDVNRTEPVPDGLDMRYDMCESRVCQDESNCEEYALVNEGLEVDGDIYIRQYNIHGPTYLETICTFEVVGFLHDIWSPHIYFRQWAGFNYTLLNS